VRWHKAWKLLWSRVCKKAIAVPFPFCKQEVQLLPKDPHTALYRPISRNVVICVVRITQTDRVLARRALSALQLQRFIPRNALCIGLYTHRSTIVKRACDAVGVISKLPYDQSCWCHHHVNRICDQPTSTITKVVDDTAYSSASTPSWTRTTVEHGHKFSAARRLSRRLLESRPVEKRNFYLAHLCLAPSLGWFYCNFAEIFCCNTKLD